MGATRGARRGALAVVGVVLVPLAGCGGGDDGGGATGGGSGGAADSAPVVVGTTDVPTSFPAGSYDLPSWTMIYNTHQRLLQIPPGGNEPEPDAAESCEFSEPEVYTCTLKEGLTFHDGSPLTAEDVAFSFQRVLDIEDPSGPSSLLGSLGSLESVEATDEQTVTFRLNKPDATWPFILTTGAGAIVPSDAYPADALQPNDQAIGSGPYQLERYQDGQRAQLLPFAEY